jgi:hypothetical protein
VLHVRVTEHPNARWIVQQLREAFAYDTVPRYLVFDNDKTYGSEVLAVIEHMGIGREQITPCSPWQNGVAERWVESVRRDLLDHEIVLNERHLHRLLSEFVAYYHDDRTHLGLGKSTPSMRMATSTPNRGAEIVGHERIGRLHHRYEWRQAAWRSDLRNRHLHPSERTPVTEALTASRVVIRARPQRPIRPRLQRCRTGSAARPNPERDRRRARITFWRGTTGRFQLRCGD